VYHYPFHVSDYVSDTAHLTQEEDLAYRRLLDHYYSTESPIVNDPIGVARRIRMAGQEDLIDCILKEFFELNEVDDRWHKKRCDEEIAKYQGFIEAGKRGAEIRWAKRGLIEANSPAITNLEPRTENREPIIKEGKPSLLGSTFPPCPHMEILKLWGKNLPHLTQHRSWEGNRQANMRQRWIQAGKPSAYSPEGYKTTEEGLKWWDSFFGYIANDTSLANGFETKGRTWKPDLEWVVNATNFQKIIDGKYAK
jgi:uncharacterized protein YdaU (DUF1376 family)